MARPRSQKVEDIKERIRTRLRAGVERPGDRFLSTRALADTFGISYQTAHRLSRELCAEGLLERRAASGTFIPGGSEPLSDVQLLFSARARRPQSFGARLLRDLTRRLDRDRLPWEVAWTDSKVEIEDGCFPVIWESPLAVETCLHQGRSVLLLNDRPRPGLRATFVDSVGIDDFWGGVCAAQLLQGEQADQPLSPRFAVVAGPTEDARSGQRRDGFLSLVPAAAVVPAASWFFEDGYRVAGDAVRLGPDGVFCCNDRLAQAVVAWCNDHHVARPPLVGFDDAPIAERLNLTTIAVPWDEMIAGAVDIIKRRLAGDTSAARQLIVTPRPVVRGTFARPRNG